MGLLFAVRVIAMPLRGCSCTAAVARLPMAVPEHRASRQPRLPQSHWGPVAQDGDMPEFAGISVAAAVDFAVDDDARADAGADGVVDDVAAVFARAKSKFSQCAHVGIVVDYCGYAEVLFDNFRQWAIVPSRDVGGVDDALCVKVDGTAKSYATGQYG